MALGQHMCVVLFVFSSPNFAAELFYPDTSHFAACTARQNRAPHKTVVWTKNYLACANECGKRDCCRFRVEGNECTLFRPNLSSKLPQLLLQLFTRQTETWPCPIHTSGSKYYLIQKKLTWNEAFYTCRLRFGRLAELDSKAKVDYFLQLINSSPG